MSSHWRASIETHGKPSLALSYVTGEESGTRIPLNPGTKYVLGRGDDADVVIPDRKASRNRGSMAKIRPWLRSWQDRSKPLSPWI